jgi:hypothetical protein
VRPCRGGAYKISNLKIRLHHLILQVEIKQAACQYDGAQKSMVFWRKFASMPKRMLQKLTVISSSFSFFTLRGGESALSILYIQRTQFVNTYSSKNVSKVFRYVNQVWSFRKHFLSHGRRNQHTCLRHDIRSATERAIGRRTVCSAKAHFPARYWAELTACLGGCSLQLCNCNILQYLQNYIIKNTLLYLVWP